jgi:prefoldin alpha subunit
LEDAQKAEKVLGEYELYRAQAEVYKQNVELLTANITELTIVRDSLDQIKDLKKDNEVLVPIGAGSFVRARIIDVEKVVVGLGADVSVKKDIPAAKVDLENRIKEMEKLRAEQSEKLQFVLSKIEELTPKVQEILTKLQKEG